MTIATELSAALAAFDAAAQDHGWASDQGSATRAAEALSRYTATKETLLKLLSARAGAWTIPAGFALLPLESSDALLRPFYECPPEELKLAWQAMHMIAKKMHPAPALPAPAGGWTGNADADLALILLDRLDDTGEGNAVRIEQLEGLVRKLAAAPAAAPAWQPIETAPKDRGRLILLHGDGPAIKSCSMVGNWGDDGWRECWILSPGNTVFEPTHWMPLPAAPEFPCAATVSGSDA